VIAALEKDANVGRQAIKRWHIHAALEPPRHLSADEFEIVVRRCWAKTDWGYIEADIHHQADQGWINYMLKSRGKSELENWFDCVILESFNNPSLT
jgi:hypothetical protein